MIQEYLERWRFARRWKKIMLLLGGMIAVFTICALIRPAITLDSGACELPEHTHTVSCYTQSILKEQTCAVGHEHGTGCISFKDTGTCCYADYAIHTHESICCDDGILVCTLSEYEGQEHTHGSECFETITDLSGDLVEVCVCGQMEVCEHCHGEECFERPTQAALSCTETADGHEHGVFCYGNWSLTCTLEEHVHTDACQGTVYCCGLEEHEHQETACYSTGNDSDGNEIKVLGCTLTEHSHSDACVETQVEEPVTFCAADVALDENAGTTYYCKKDVHEHDAACCNADGTLICSEEEHVHNKLCSIYQSEYLCYLLGYHVHSNDCYNESWELVCTEEEHAHTALCKVYYCCDVDDNSANKTHIYTEDCLSEDGSEWNCTNHIHTADCLVMPDYGTEYTPSVGNKVHEEVSVEGTQWHSSQYEHYQISEHMLQGNQEATLFMLVPKEEWDNGGWTPNTKSWTARADANYVVAYCADAETFSGSDLAYETYTIDSSRFASESQRRNLSGIIANSYPFISASEMKARLITAYENGEIAYDVSCCTESDYILAVQWAIWSVNSDWYWWDDYVTNYYFKNITDDYGLKIHRGFYGPIQSECWNPLTNWGHLEEEGYVKDAGEYSQATTILTSHTRAIKDWLMKQYTAEELTVTAYEPLLSQNADGTYTLKVDVQLNRSVLSGETAAYQLIAGEKASLKETVFVGESSFSVTLEGLEYREISKAEVDLKITGEHMQAYFFDNATNQDMIGGRWEEYEENLSFDVGLEVTSVSVVKEWSDTHEGIPSVAVQLYGNGVPKGEPVSLSNANSWMYVWDALIKNDSNGQAIEYTVREVPVDGYQSTVTVSSSISAEKTIQMWKKVDDFNDGGTFLLLSRHGALAYYPYSLSSYSISWKNVDLSDVTSEQNGAIFTVTPVGDDYCLYQNNIGRYLYGEGVSKSSYTTFNYSYVNGKGYFHSVSDGNWYYQGHYSNSGAVTTYDVNCAISFELYELVEIPVPQYDINIVITNTPLVSACEVDVTVTKEWSGRLDGVYPDAVSVNLLQNGRAYGNTVILNSDNEWTYLWEKLPYQDNDGNQFIYTVEEVACDGYSGVLEVVSSGMIGDDFYYEMKLCNTWSPDTVNLILNKADALDEKQMLSGAIFDLYVKSKDETASDAVTIPGTDSAGFLMKSGLITDGAGSLTIDGVAVGETYYLVETKAPDGYNLLEAPVGFYLYRHGTVVDLILQGNNAAASAMSGSVDISTRPITLLLSPSLTIRNYSGYELPETGGSGSGIYAAVGLGLTLGAGVFLCRKALRKKGR